MRQNPTKIPWSTYWFGGISSKAVIPGVNLGISVTREQRNSRRHYGDIKGRNLENIFDSYIQVSTSLVY